MPRNLPFLRFITSRTSMSATAAQLPKCAAICSCVAEYGSWLTNTALRFFQRAFFFFFFLAAAGAAASSAGGSSAAASAFSAADRIS